MAIPTTVGASSCSTSPSTFLNGLPPNTKIYPYHGLSSIEEATDNSHPDFHPSESQYIVFNNVPESDFNTVLEEQLPGRADYDQRTQTLILKMVSQPHETLTHSLEWSINKKAEEMGQNMKLPGEPKNLMRNTFLVSLHKNALDNCPPLLLRQDSLNPAQDLTTTPNFGCGKLTVTLRSRSLRTSTDERGI
ncbi:hypothetical protein FQN53_004847 [Emmonsiellopsis sp. PD_33]|nr:hypothetical protein FQN53_004847 [Emmonsiellopsis sp. PD_33]